MITAQGNSRTSEGTSIVKPIASAFVAGSAAALTPFQCSWQRKAERRLGELCRLQIGWDGHRGQPANRDIAEFAASVLASLMQPKVPMPAIVPLSYGGIQIEWHRKGWDIEIEISAPNQMHIYQHEIASGDEEEFDLGADLSRLGAVIDAIKD